MDLTSYHSFLEEILVVLVIYNIDLEESTSFKSLDRNLQDYCDKLDIFIYDNSSIESEAIDRDRYDRWHFWYVRDRQNSGVSKAYNEGFKVARKLNKKWLLLLDQDTEFSTDALKEYYLAVRDCSEDTIFAPMLVSDDDSLYSPCKYQFYRGFPLKKAKFGLQSNQNISLLNSGLLISIDIFEKIGGYNEKLKLDFSDFEFLDRYRQVFRSFFIINSKAIHGFSGDLDNNEASYKRFQRYCQSILVINQILPRAFILWIFAFLRACKLALKFKDSRFFLVFLPSFLK